ncbi:uncharacterized protein LOC119794223 [Cyprinodon tularosa]|uniref:uncharacterized protein LOC119794223 n=1 Tax=Cyprinodon tularosa TaxID=77115 RepID=UPI0018E20FF9|nr:uncharacterized protein LOC119794223 [Cyprinodon tularosa]
MSFSFEEFVQAPSHAKLELCRKDDLLCLAEHFDIPVKKHFSKAEIKNIVVRKLVEIKVLTDSSKMDVDVCDDSSVDLGLHPSKDKGAPALATPPKELVEPRTPPATLPRFDPVSPEFSGSSGNARLKVRLARLQLEAQERELQEAQRKKMAYVLDDGLLLRRWAGENLEDWNATYQVVVPTPYRRQVLALAHDHPLSGHLGINKTYDKVLRHFFWPVMGEPFGRVIVDCVGPLPKSRSGNQYILTMMCASTRVVQTDQGTNFKSRTFAQALKQWGIEHVTSSSYHPESQGALERFHQTLKTMLRKYCMETERDWDEECLDFKAGQTETALRPESGHS